MGLVVLGGEEVGVVREGKGSQKNYYNYSFRMLGLGGDLKVVLGYVLFSRLVWQYREVGLFWMGLEGVVSFWYMVRILFEVGFFFVLSVLRDFDSFFFLFMIFGMQQVFFKY